MGKRKRLLKRIAAAAAAVVIAAGSPAASSATVVSGSSGYMNLNSLMFGFSNVSDELEYYGGESIPWNVYQQCFGNTELAKVLYENASARDGSGFGMSMASALFNYGSEYSTDDYKSGASQLSLLKPGDVNSETGSSLREFIERCELMKYTPAVARPMELHRDGSYKEKVPYIKDALSSGAPPMLITITGSAGSGEVSHTVVPYAWRNLGQNLTRIYVYDPDYDAGDTSDEYYINTLKDGNNWYVSWSYSLAKRLEWSSLFPLGSLTYVEYDSYSNAIKEPFSEDDKRLNLLITDAMNFTITGRAGNLLARVENGDLYTLDPVGIFQVIQNSVTKNGVEVLPSKLMIWLPAELDYTITGMGDTPEKSIGGKNFTVSSYYVSAPYTSPDNSMRLSVGGDGVISYNGIASSVTRSEGMVASRFSDVYESSWYFNAVIDMVERGIITGYEDGTFRPDGNVTRLEFAAMALRAFGRTPEGASDEVTAANGEGFWGNGYISEAIASGIAEFGISADEWSEQASRAEMAHIAMAIAQNAGGQEFAVSDGLSERIADYGDVEASLFAEDIFKAYSEGIITGMDDGTFSASANSTRAQAATVIRRVIEPEARVK